MNDEITSSDILLIDDNGKALGTVNLDQAMWLAWEKGVDLVEVGPNARPPVVRLLDYGKYQYEQSKAEAKSRTHAPETKEVRLTLKIGSHDFDVKKRQAEKWLSEGDRVRITATLFGREMMFKDRAHDMIERMRLALETEYETPVTMAGKRFSAVVSRKR